MKKFLPLVVLVVAVAIAGGVVLYMHSPRQEALRTVALISVRSAGIGAALYSDAHDGTFTDFCNNRAPNSGIECNSTATAWAVSTKISWFEHACVDSSMKDQSKPKIGFRALGSSVTCP